MGVLPRFTLRSLRRNRVRTVVTVVGAMLSCALITAVLTSAASLIDAMYAATLETEGAWQLAARDVPRDTVDDLLADPDVDGVSVVASLGSAQVGSDGAAEGYVHLSTLPRSLREPARANPVQAPLAPKVDVVEGRLPAAEDEIVVPVAWRGSVCEGPGVTGTLELGGTVEVSPGTRYARDPETGERVRLDARQQLFGDDGALLPETVEDSGPARRLAVVGFYRDDAAEYAAANGFYAFCGGTGDGAEGAYDTVYLSTGLDSYDAVARLANEAFGEGGADLHTSLMRYEGLTDDRRIYDTLYGFAAVLAAVIVVASVSLIYNSFAISVSERTRQFGLLSSLGASRRQLRRTVLTEALLVAAAGVPAGALVGLAGCAVVFHLTQEGFDAMLNLGGGALKVSVSPAVLAVSCLLSLATILVSAWLPAVRASRVPAVDAIRQARDVRVRGRSARRLAALERKGTRFVTERDVAPRGLAARLLGVPGLVASRNLKRNASKGRIATASLAVSVALLIVAGSLTESLDFAVGAAIDEGAGQDLYVNVWSTDEGDVTQGELEDLRQVALSVEGVEGASWARSQRVVARIPASVYDAGSLENAGLAVEGTSEGPGGFSSVDGGAYTGEVAVSYVDGETWDALCREAGVSPGGAGARAIAVNVPRKATVDGMYAEYSEFKGTGAVEAYSFRDVAGSTFAGFTADDGGEPCVCYMDDKTGEVSYVPLDEARASTVDVRVVALAEDDGAAAFQQDGPSLIMPASAYGTVGGTLESSSDYLVVDAGGSAEAADAAQDALDAHMGGGRPGIAINVSNLLRSKLQARLMSQTVRTFVYCFVVITGLIAVANVFNTIANSVMLRAREFAMLRSAGMGERSFRTMIACECAAYAVRGLAGGLVLAALACLGFYQALGLSFAGASFTMPWAHVVAAALVAVAVLAASTAFALGRIRSGSIVETLREDAF